MRTSDYHEAVLQTRISAMTAITTKVSKVFISKCVMTMTDGSVQENHTYMIA